MFTAQENTMRIREPLVWAEQLSKLWCIDDDIGLPRYQLREINVNESDILT